MHTLHTVFKADWAISYLLLQGGAGRVNAHHNMVLKAKLRTIHHQLRKSLVFNCSFEILSTILPSLHSVY